jgi:cell wall-associated NlpC family hydrolase
MPGDLLFFGPNPEQINHVAIYIGDYEYIHCSAWVRINSLKPGVANCNDYLLKKLRYVRRIIGK